MASGPELIVDLLVTLDAELASRPEIVPRPGIIPSA